MIIGEKERARLKKKERYKKKERMSARDREKERVTWSEKRGEKIEKDGSDSMLRK